MISISTDMVHGRRLMPGKLSADDNDVGAGEMRYDNPDLSALPR